MNPLDADIVRRARAYAEQHSLSLDRRLGFGKDGTVWETTEQTAVKAFGRTDRYQRELTVYQRLARLGVLDVLGHHVPQLVQSDDVLLVIEMTIVQPPFVLDFAGAYLDNDAPEFPDDVMDEWRARKAEEFGPNWARAVGVVAGLARHGIHMTDVHPGNISFGHEGD